MPKALKPGHRKVQVRVWHLQMTERPAPVTLPRPYELRQTTKTLPELNRFLYSCVGSGVCWYMRLGWTWQEWHDYLNQENVTTWVAYEGATPVGYFELERHDIGAPQSVLPENAEREKSVKEKTVNEKAVSEKAVSEKAVNEKTVQIAYFGLLPEFIGKGKGSRLLMDAIEKAWETAEDGIWLHTCDLDHPAALPNYLSRGFSIAREGVFEDSVPIEKLQPWPDANKPDIDSSANKKT